MELRTSRVFDRTAEAFLHTGRYVSSCGGTRSGKTYAIIQLIYLFMLGEARRGARPCVFSVVSESMPHLRRGAIRDFRTILQGAGLWDAAAWSETMKTYTFANGGVIEFFSVDNAGKVFGASRSYLYINEVQHIGYETARQLFVRTRLKIILDYNPTHAFWVMEKVEPRPNCIRIHSTYKDNDFLSREQVEEIESSRGDANWWRVFGEGEVGTLDGLVFEFAVIDALPPRGLDKPQAEKSPEELYADTLVEVQGLDFGFTNDPTARVQVYADPKRKRLYVRERCYRTRMQNRHIIEDLQADGVSSRVEIYADCAEPKSIADIEEAGFNVLACDKDAPVKSDKISFQLQWLRGWELNVTKDSLNLINELRNYTWAKDKDGNALNYPIDKFNHAIDALRYAVWTKFGRDAGAGNYHLSVKRNPYAHN